MASELGYLMSCCVAGTAKLHQIWRVFASLTIATLGPSTVSDIRVHEYLSSAWTNKRINELDLKANGEDWNVFSLAKNIQRRVYKLRPA